MAQLTLKESSTDSGIFKNPINLQKWDLLFNEELNKEWIAFEPSSGMTVYPCYSCRQMFASKKSFLDHINRRAVLLKYFCTQCLNNDFTFYNRCSFLLHCRQHFTVELGQLDLKKLEILTLPVHLAGFFRLPEIPYLYDVEEDPVNIFGNSTVINTQFYRAIPENRGKDLINLRPIQALIKRKNCKAGEKDDVLTIRQIAKNIPKCEFVPLNLNNSSSLMVQSNFDRFITNIAIKPEIIEPLIDAAADAEEVHQNNNVNNFMLPVIMKTETVNEDDDDEDFQQVVTNIPVKKVFRFKCPECKLTVRDLTYHFVGENKPLSEKYQCNLCKLICSSSCSFKAHLRIHTKKDPYVCPECGIQFNTPQTLFSHMDKICFHLVKSVRIRCPGKRCGKVFASEGTFGPHFKHAHIDTKFMCGSCKEISTNLEDSEEHCLTHQDDDNGYLVKLFSCSTCDVEGMNFQKLKQHLNFHCKDLSRRIYIFMCKYCKCYFRSVQTMGAHLNNCKVHKTGISKRRNRAPVEGAPSSSSTTPSLNSKYFTGTCTKCGTKIICLKSKPSTICNKCLANPSTSEVEPISIAEEKNNQPKKNPISLPEKCICILCRTQIDFSERRQHQLQCKFSKPQVVVQQLDLNVPFIKLIQQHHLHNSNNNISDNNDELLPLKARRESISSDDNNRPKKRLRSHYNRTTTNNNNNNSNINNKRNDENDLTADEPMQFAGTYQCRICDYKNTKRQNFHDHIIRNHRNISTAYQCMECGECFVVKPSLQKHLLHFHNISDSAEYFLKNDCFDHSAVTELAKVVKAPYLAVNVKENQCKICMEEFGTVEEHDKHFRVHGMAFLMKSFL